MGKSLQTKVDRMVTYLFEDKKVWLCESWSTTSLFGTVIETKNSDFGKWHSLNHLYYHTASVIVKS